ncbi:pyruvate kinase, cytosolic isozyme [Gossypium australe]|uniref:Pyruvate kinase n=3 Tax=Gossypium TaxID=3633 RepID=A0A5B6WMI8_9ROSI|nr:pyruvate kinase, cytosolic isozyme [Gossypium australe]
MANIDIDGILKELPNDGRIPKTKIVCTLGPASRSVPMIEKLLRAGMNVARFNFSHGSHEYHQETLDNLRSAMHNTGILCAVMLDTKSYLEITQNFLYMLVLCFSDSGMSDTGTVLLYGIPRHQIPCGRLAELQTPRLRTPPSDSYSGTPRSTRSLTESPSQVKWVLYTDNLIQSEKPHTYRHPTLDLSGPEIRTGFLKDGKAVQLKEGQEITVTTDYDIKGDEKMISMSYKKLAVDLKPGNTILCADGTITLSVLSCDPAAGTVRCRCGNTAMIGERKNVNLPGVVVDLPTLTEKDKEDILGWGVPNSIDMIALSFVRKGSDLVNVRKVLGPHAKKIQLMSKVENQEGVINFDEILRETDAFMVARGDLGMEIPVEKIFLAQKMMIYKCNLAGKPVVTATQMLESMIKSPRPTRAEATDVANAVLDGTDCVMLSGESAAGAYPELAVKIMARICIEAESSLDYGAIFKEMIRSTPLPMSPLESLASSAVRTANKAKAKLIVVLTRGGTTAKLVAKYRPAVPILSVVVPVLTTDSFDWTCSDEGPARHSLIYRGLVPILAEGSAKATDAESTEVILEAAMKSATEKGLCKPGDAIVALHRIGAASVIKICIVK